MYGNRLEMTWRWRTIIYTEQWLNIDLILVIIFHFCTNVMKKSQLFYLSHEPLYTCGPLCEWTRQKGGFDYFFELLGEFWRNFNESCDPDCDFLVSQIETTYLQPDLFLFFFSKSRCQNSKSSRQWPKKC